MSQIKFTNLAICIFLLFIIICFSIFAGGCDFNFENSSGSGKLNIITTNFPLYDFARQICGYGESNDNETIVPNVMLLLPPGVESHTYEPSPRDIIRIQECDLFIYVGGDSDAWVDRILSNMDKPVRSIKLIDYIDAVEEELSEGMEAESEHEHEHNHEVDDKIDYDPHIWTSPKNAVKMIKAIQEEICRLDASNTDFYKSNADKYNGEIQRLDFEFTEFFKTIKNKCLIFGDRFPFRYFAEAYNLKYYAAFPGCSTQSEPGSATIAFLIDKVKSEKISTVFYIEFSNHGIADSIAAAANVKTALLHSCHNISSDDIDNNVTYLSLMEQNLKTLKGAMK